MKKINLLCFTLVIAALCSAGSSYAQTCPAGMVAYWRLQESGGTTFSDEKNSHDAMASSAPSQVAGISGKGQFFGGFSYLSVPSHSQFNWASNSSFAIELWVKFSNSEANTQVMIGRDDPTNQTHWWIGKTASGTIQWYMRASDGSNGAVTTSSAYNNGQWHHIVAVRDGATQKNYLYVNGILQNTGGTTVSLGGNLSSTADLTIGNMIFNNSPMYYFDGSIDEVAIYSTILSGTDVSAHYNNMRNYQIGYCSSDSPELLSAPLTTSVISQTYSYDVDASGNPLPTYSLVSGPTGMTINATTGVISWTPLSFSQNAPVVVRATNTLGSVDQEFSINMADVPECRDNLIAYWNFNKAGGAPFVDDISGYKLTGSGASQVTGKLGYGVAFDGVNDSLNLIDPESTGQMFFDFDNVPNFSIEVWVKSNASPSQTMVIVGREEDENNTQYWLGINPDGTAGLFLRDYPATPNTAYLEGGSVLDGAWHHIVATFNATTNNIKLYVDKIAVDEANQNFLNFGGNDPLNIGCMNTSLDKFWFEGIIDELAFYNTELTEATITSNFDAVAAGNGACILNYAPLITTTPVILVNEDEAYSYRIEASDLNATDVLSITAVTKPSWLNLAYNAGNNFAVLSGTPENDQVGSHAVTLRVSDGSINVDQTFSIQVVNVNDNPVITSTPGTSVNEDSEYSYTMTGADVDAGTTLTYSAVSIPEWMSFNAATNVLSGTPTNDEVGIWDITLAISDGTVSIEQEFQLTVNNVNDLPVITSIPEDTVVATNVYMYELVATDVDEGDELVYSAVTLPEWLIFTAGANSGIITGTPTNDHVGTHAVILKVNDGHGDVMHAFSIVVNQFVSVKDIDNSIIHRVYPNPSSQVVYFRFQNSGKSKIELYDISGKLQKQIDSDNAVVEIQISDLANGIYVYKAYQNDKLSIGKISKE